MACSMSHIPKREPGTACVTAAAAWLSVKSSTVSRGNGSLQGWHLLASVLPSAAGLHGTEALHSPLAETSSHSWRPVQGSGRRERPKAACRRRPDEEQLIDASQVGMVFWCVDTPA